MVSLSQFGLGTAHRIVVLEEIKRHGPKSVFKNRVNRARRLREQGHFDAATLLDKEACYARQIRDKRDVA